MRIAIISASNKQPDWVRGGFETYARRLRGSCRLELREVPLPRRGSTKAPGRVVDEEGEKILGALPKSAHAVALDERGQPWTTTELAARLGAWQELGQPIALLIGGPDGLAAACRERCAEQWAISPLTLPHGLVRIVVAEALYRAFSLREGHPYHRA